MKRMMILFLFPVFLWLGCEKEETDPCAEIVCLNDGFCANGLCNCPDGYGGSDCSQQVEPESVDLLTIRLITWPLLAPSGGGWDSNSGPDIFIRILDDNGNEIYESGYYDNVQNGSTPIWDVDLRVEDASSNPLTVQVYDYDGILGNHFMIGATFRLYRYDQNIDFPNTLTLSIPNLSIELALGYNH